MHGYFEKGIPMNNRPLAALAAITLAGALMAGCSSTPASNPSASGGVALVSSGTLSVCTNPPFKPMEYVDDSGNVVGFDMDIMQLVATKLGVTMNVVQTDFSQITSGAAMAAQKCDIGASAITITDARKNAVTFSNPYFAATQALAVKTGSGINGLADLKGKNLAVETDTTGADYANANSAQYGYSVVVFDDGGTALNAILSGRADACLIDNAIAYDFVNSNSSSTQVVTEFQTGETYGFATMKNANGQALADVVNQVLATASSDGTYLTLYKKWINPSATSASLPDPNATPSS